MAVAAVEMIVAVVAAETVVLADLVAVVEQEPPVAAVVAVAVVAVAAAVVVADAAAVVEFGMFEDEEMNWDHILGAEKQVQNNSEVKDYCNLQVDDFGYNFGVKEKSCIESEE